jgi:Zn-dependent M28 family amino/carboxypeptidase
VVLNNDPDWSDDLFAGNRRLYYGRWTYKYESAARQGAAGALIVHTTPSAGYPWQVVQTSWGGEQFELPAGDEPRLGVAGWTTEEATRKLLAAAGHDLDALARAARSRDFRPVPLGIRTSLVVETEMRRIETANVLGLLPGRDESLADQAVIYTAHHDHLGTGEPDAEGDAIYNGAIDNATGCAELLEIAQAIVALPAEQRPRRSILFAFVAAEEQGLLGSKYFAAHPTVPPGRIAAAVNLDAGNAFGRTRDVTYIGYGKSSLDAVIEAAAASQGRVVRGDAFPDRGAFYRSDQFSFAKIGVPALYLDGGTDFVGKDPEFGKRLQERFESTCYHQPCDEVADDWDLSGMVEDARLAFLAGLAIANADAMPAWNPGDEFEAARKAAIAAPR